MATLIPTLGSARFDTRGELRLAERLRALQTWRWLQDLLHLSICSRPSLTGGPF